MSARGHIVPVVDEGLGNSSYVVDLDDGRALVVDPERDPRPYLVAAAGRGLRLAFSAETHLHAASFAHGQVRLKASTIGFVVVGRDGFEPP
jgi:hydroxyacylglutathione hydrolase